MSLVIERVARAICSEVGDNPDAEAMDSCDPKNDGRPNWESWKDEALAALMASGYSEIVEALKEAEELLCNSCEEAGGWDEDSFGAMTLYKIRSALARASQTNTGE